MPLSLQEFRQQYPMYNDVPDEKLVPAMHQRFYPEMPYNEFADKIGASTSHGIGDAALGALQTVGSGIASMPGAALNAVSDILHRIGGNDESRPVVGHVPNGAAGERLMRGFQGTPRLSIQELRAGQEPGDEKLTDDQLRAKFERAYQGSNVADEVLPQQGTVAGDLTRGALKVGSDVAAIAPVAGAAKSVAGGLLTGAEEGATTGLRTGANSPVARTIAGKSGQEALQHHNQQVADSIAAGEANHPAGTPMSYEALSAAQKAPSDVYTRVAAALPEGSIDDAARAGIDAAGGGQGKLVTSSPVSQTQIANMKAQLAQPMNGQQLIDNLRSLRQEGFRRAGSEDVDQQAVGKAQLDMARALEGHIIRNLPQGGDVTPADFQAARKSLAKNYTVQSALRGSNVDMRTLARIQRNDPELLDGGLKELADFANGPGRDVSGLPSTYDQPNFGKDALEAIDIHHPVKGVTKFLGGAAARRQLTGNTAQAVDNAVSRFGATPGRFDPRPSLTPPPGQAWRNPTQPELGDMGQGPGPAPWTLEQGANPNPPAPAARQGELSLADVLSHGVEPRLPEGLSARPMEAPPQEGLPFTRNAAHEAGGLELAPEDSWFKGGPKGLGDELAGVMSQGVPEDIMSRAPARRFVGDTVDFPGGAPRRQIVENNASGESAASLEAQRRLAHERSTGSAPFTIDPEGNPQTLAHTTDAVDVKAPKGHLKVQLDPTTGKLSIMDRGGMTLQAARGLLNRYMALHGMKLGDALGS